VDLDRHYTDPRLTALYDAVNSGRDDTEHYVALAQRLGSGDVVDVGCGTGVLACELAARGHRTCGVDPATAMLDVARDRPGADRVTWVHGTAADLPADAFDLAIMTGHVAQVFLTDDDWTAQLADLARAVRAGGHLAFESRNPDAEAWRWWTREHTFDTYWTDDGQVFDSWAEVIGVGDGVVHFESHTVMRSSGEHLLHTSALRFRTQDELRGSLEAAGFRVRQVLGDWDGSPVAADRPELIFLARRC
jgi:ubiquinone/menaquinone biosynthesis C-methylase UbiE